MGFCGFGMSLGWWVLFMDGFIGWMADTGRPSLQRCQREERGLSCDASEKRERMRSPMAERREKGRAMPERREMRTPGRKNLRREEGVG